MSQHHTNFVFRHVMKLVKVPFLKNIFSLLPNLFQLPWKVRVLLFSFGEWGDSRLVSVLCCIWNIQNTKPFSSAGRDSGRMFLSCNCLKYSLQKWKTWVLCILWHKKFVLRIPCLPGEWQVKVKIPSSMFRIILSIVWGFFGIWCTLTGTKFYLLALGWYLN